MAVKPASQWASNWSGSSAKASGNYVAGIQAYSGDWASATVAAQGLMLQNVTQAIQNGRWSTGVQRAGTTKWKQMSEQKSTNYVTGFSAGGNNYAAAAAKLQPFLSSAVAALPARGDINQNLQRSAALALALHQQRGNFKA